LGHTASFGTLHGPKQNAPAGLSFHAIADIFPDIFLNLSSFLDRSDFLMAACTGLAFWLVMETR
jgi:hypothetical protein